MHGTLVHFWQLLQSIQINFLSWTGMRWQYKVFILVKLMSHVVVGRGTQAMRGVGEFEIYMSKISLLRP